MESAIFGQNDEPEAVYKEEVVPEWLFGDWAVVRRNETILNSECLPVLDMGMP